MIYKPTSCEPLLLTFDATQIPFFLECQIDSANTKVDAYSIKLLNSENNEVVFGHEDDEFEETVTLISDLKTYFDTNYASYDVGYINLNTGLNGSFLKIPFIVADGMQDTSSVKYNQLYYQADAQGDHFYYIKDNTPIPIPIYNGIGYKWQITLYQLENNTKPASPKYYDMLVTNGVVMGSNQKRIQSVKSDKILADYYIQPIRVDNLSYDPGDPIGWTGGEITSRWPRVLIKSYDPTYGYIYPVEGSDGFAADIIEPTNGANAFRIYKRGNSSENLTAYQKIAYVIDKNIKLRWETTLTNISESYGEYKYNTTDKQTAYNFTDLFGIDGIGTVGEGARLVLNGQGLIDDDNRGIYVAKNSIDTPSEGELNVNPYEDTSDWFDTGLTGLDKVQEWKDNVIYNQYDIVKQNNIYYLSLNSANLGNEPSTRSWYNLGAEPSVTSWSGNAAYNQYALCTYKSHYILSNGTSSGSPYNGIFYPTFSSNAIRNASDQIIGYENIIKFMRTPDADTWGELTNKIVYVESTSSPYYGNNIQPSAALDVSSGNYYGIINETPVTFVPEKPIAIYTDGIDDDHNEIGIIFYNSITKPAMIASGERIWRDYLSYDQYSIVYYEPILNVRQYYVSLVDNNIGNFPPENSSVWKNLNRHDKPLYHTDWSSTSTYNQYDIVIYEELWYISKINNNTNITPQNNTSGAWYLLGSSTDNMEGYIYIRPFIGVQSDQILMLDNTTNLQKFIRLNDVNSDYWFVRYTAMSGYNINNQRTYTIFDQLSNWLPDTTKYTIKTFYRDSDENPFYFNTAPYIHVQITNADGTVFPDDNQLYKGDYNITKTYAVGDLVWYKGQYFQYIGRTQQPYSKPVFDIPVYAASNSYNIGDIVSYDGTYYYCIQDAGVGKLPTVETYWEKYQWQPYIITITGRSMNVFARYDQNENIQWKMAQWFLYDANGDLFDNSDIIYNQNIEYQYNGLGGIEYAKYILELVVETYQNYREVIKLNLLTNYVIERIDGNEIVDVTFDCDRMGVVSSMIAVSEFVGPDPDGGTKGDISYNYSEETQKGTMTVDGEVIYDSITADFNYAAAGNSAPIRAYSGEFEIKLSTRIDTNSFMGSIVKVDTFVDTPEGSESDYSDNNIQSTIQIYAPDPVIADNDDETWTKYGTDKPKLVINTDKNKFFIRTNSVDQPIDLYMSESGTLEPLLSADQFIDWLESDQINPGAKVFYTVSEWQPEFLQEYVNNDLANTNFLPLTYISSPDGDAVKKFIQGMSLSAQDRIYFNLNLEDEFAAYLSELPYSAESEDSVPHYVLVGTESQDHPLLAAVDYTDLLGETDPIYLLLIDNGYPIFVSRDITVEGVTLHAGFQRYDFEHPDRVIIDDDGILNIAFANVSIGTVNDSADQPRWNGLIIGVKKANDYLNVDNQFNIYGDILLDTDSAEATIKHVQQGPVFSKMFEQNDQTYSDQDKFDAMSFNSTSVTVQYNDTNTYNRYDVVLYNDNYYKSLIDNNISNTPGTDESKWELISLATELVMIGPTPQIFSDLQYVIAGPVFIGGDNNGNVYYLEKNVYKPTNGMILTDELVNGDVPIFADGTPSCETDLSNINLGEVFINNALTESTNATDGSEAETLYCDSLLMRQVQLRADDDYINPERALLRDKVLNIDVPLTGDNIKSAIDIFTVNEYIDTATYKFGDIVIYDGKQYISQIDNNTNHTPSTSSIYWSETYVSPIIYITDNFNDRG